MNDARRDLFRLEGKIALVTGGAGIYGVHICTALAEAFDGFGFDLRSGVARLTLYAAAFLCMGLFVWSIEHSRRQQVRRGVPIHL